MTDTNTPHVSRLSDWLADHPRMLGALFMLVLLLTQAGGAAAAASSATNGP
jgi:hypothetical protein